MWRLPGQISARPGEQQIARLRFLHFDGGGFVQAPREHLGESFGHVLHHQEAAGEILRKLRKKILQRVGAAGGNADGDDFRRLARVAPENCAGLPLRRRHGDDHLRRAGSGCDLDFQRQLGGDLLQAAGSGVLRLGDEIECAERQRFQRERRAFLGVRADDDHRHVMLARDLAQHFDAVHARHFQIERDDVRAQLLNFSQADQAIHGGADDFDRGIAEQHLRNQLPHQRGIIDHQDANSFAHAIAPTAGMRDRCETTAGTFRISTTVPSPEDGSAADHGRSDQLIFERLDDQLFFAHQAVHGQAEPAAARADHDDENRLLCSPPACFDSSRSRRTSVSTCSRS